MHASGVSVGRNPGCGAGNEDGAYHLHNTCHLLGLSAGASPQSSPSVVVNMILPISQPRKLSPDRH